jgi:hypothetical protein
MRRDARHRIRRWGPGRSTFCNRSTAKSTSPYLSGSGRLDDAEGALIGVTLRPFSSALSAQRRREVWACAAVRPCHRAGGLVSPRCGENQAPVTVRGTANAWEFAHPDDEGHTSTLESPQIVAEADWGRIHSATSTVMVRCDAARRPLDQVGGTPVRPARPRSLRQRPLRCRSGPRATYVRAGRLARQQLVLWRIAWVPDSHRSGEGDLP